MLSVLPASTKDRGSPVQATLIWCRPYNNPSLTVSKNTIWSESTSLPFNVKTNVVCYIHITGTGRTCHAGWMLGTWSQHWPNPSRAKWHHPCQRTQPGQEAETLSETWSPLNRNGRSHLFGRANDPSWSASWPCHDRTSCCCHCESVHTHLLQSDSTVVFADFWASRGSWSRYKHDLFWGEEINFGKGCDVKLHL